MGLKTIKKIESEVRGYVRSFPTTFKSATGSTLVNDQGVEYIDFFGGAGALNYGHNNPYMKKLLIDYLQADGIVHGLDFATTPKNAFLNAFQDKILKPRGLDYKVQFTGPTGTNTVEAATKLAQIVTGRNHIISFTNGYHGHSKGALRLTANRHYRQGLENDIGQFTTFLPYCGYMDDDFSSLDYFDKVLSDPGSGMDLPAAVILEVVQGEGGINVASVEWLQRMRDITTKHDIMLIVDDIQAGCGRTGDFFSFEEAGIKPDLITLSKSLSGFGLPMSVLLISPKFDIWEPGQHTGTFRGLNLAFLTATEAIERYWADDKFSKEVKEKGKLIRSLLQEIWDENPNLIKEVRGRGLMIGVEFINEDWAQEIAHSAYEECLIIETCGAKSHVLKFLPSLTITEAEIREGVRLLRVIMEKVKTK